MIQADFIEYNKGFDHTMLYINLECILCAFINSEVVVHNVSRAIEMGDTERRPLLDDGDGDQSSSSPPPAYSEHDETSNSRRNKLLGMIHMILDLAGI